MLDACNQISERLKPYRKFGDFAEAVKAAYNDRVSLAASGYYKAVSGAGYDWKEQKGDVYTYFSFGVGCSKVLLDLQTGDHKTLSSSVLMVCMFHSLPFNCKSSFSLSFFLSRMLDSLSILPLTLAKLKERFFKELDCLQQKKSNIQKTGNCSAILWKLTTFLL